MAAVGTLVGARAQLDALERWFGPERLDDARRPLGANDLSPLRYTRWLQHRWVVRDLLAYTEARARNAVDELFVLGNLMPLCRLASAVLRFNRAGATPVPGRFRELLLGESCADYAHEIIAAAQHDWRGYHVRWLPEGAIGGEFGIRYADDADEVFVECKRLAADLIGTLKGDVVPALAEALERVLEANGWCGTVRLDIGPQHIGRPSLLVAVERLAAAMTAEQRAVQLDDITAQIDLQPLDAEQPYTDLLALAASRDPVYRVITGRRNGAMVKRPRVLEFSGPSRDGAWFARKIESVVVEQAADRQLSTEAPAVVCLELPMLRHADPIEALQVAEPVIEMLFQREHVIGFFAVLDLATQANAEAARANARGRIIWNDRSKFVAAKLRWQQVMAGNG